MKLENINVTEIIEKARKMLKDIKNVPAEFVVLFSNVLMVLEILLAKVGIEGSNPFARSILTYCKN
ncbi:MAG TPA: hypothetical protein PLY23_06260 [Alphaproteobacteria bacterium]|nr:hypothetical protein [Alphaproteobacteria bacterium]HQS93673.1 hypothetical protein [Alphaproteobacteria bacterium]